MLFNNLARILLAQAKNQSVVRKKKCGQEGEKEPRNHAAFKSQISLSPSIDWCAPKTGIAAVHMYLHKG